MEFEWRNCSLQPSAELEAQIDANMVRFSHPWSSIVKDSCRKTWQIADKRCSILPDELFGQFYQEDVYLVLMTNQGRSFVHLWVGKFAAANCYQQGCYWALSLDKHLEGQCILYREVQSTESSQFRSYFNPITYLAGSFVDGYWMRRVEQRYQPARLLKLFRPDKDSNFIVATEVPTAVSELDPACTFLLDVNKALYLWHGNLTPCEEDLVCTRYAEALRATRGLEARVEALDDDTELDAHEFYTYLARDNYRSTERQRSVALSSSQETEPIPDQLFRFTVTKRSHQNLVKYERVGLRRFGMDDIRRHNICVINCEHAVFVVLGKKATRGFENSLVFLFAHDFLQRSRSPLRPIIIVRHKQQCVELDQYLDSIA